jgi:hypothetical protein
MAGDEHVFWAGDWPAPEKGDGLGRMNEEDEQELRFELARLRQEHSDLDAAIAVMSETGRIDPLRIQRLKKKKLALKDRIAVLEDQLLPDISA